jgi:hypothetical protein
VLFTLLLATLECLARPARPVSPPVPVPYERVDARHLDESQSFEIVLGLVGGGGADAGSPHRATQYGALKVGAGCCTRGKHPNERGETVTMDIGWDRLRGRSAVSFEMSLMVGVVRFPRPLPNQSRRFVRVYAEPGVGVRAGGGSFAYYSAKAMIAFMSDDQILKFANGPIVEIQHRFPFNSLSRGDTRILVGVMAPLCKHC